MSNKTKIHYVDNKLFYQEIVAYKERIKQAKKEGKEPPRIPEYLGQCIWKIANGLSYKPSFVNYSFRDEMVSDGIENCIMYFEDFDPKRTQNPFAYFTQIIYFAFLRRIHREEKNRYTIYKNFEATMLTGGQANLLRDEENNLIPTQLYDNIGQFMQRYEDKEAAKKKKRRKVGKSNGKK